MSRPKVTKFVKGATAKKSPETVAKTKDADEKNRASREEIIKSLGSNKKTFKKPTLAPILSKIKPVSPVLKSPPISFPPSNPPPQIQKSNLKKPKKSILKYVLGVLFLGLLLVGGVAAFYLNQQQQDVRQQAYLTEDEFGQEDYNPSCRVTNCIASAVSANTRCVNNALQECVLYDKSCPLNGVWRVTPGATCPKEEVEEDVISPEPTPYCSVDKQWGGCGTNAYCNRNFEGGECKCRDGYETKSACDARLPNSGCYKTSSDLCWMGCPSGSSTSNTGGDIIPGTNNQCYIKQVAGPCCDPFFNEKIVYPSVCIDPNNVAGTIGTCEDKCINSPDEYGEENSKEIGEKCCGGGILECLSKKCSVASGFGVCVENNIGGSAEDSVVSVVDTIDTCTPTSYTNSNTCMTIPEGASCSNYVLGRFTRPMTGPNDQCFTSVNRKDENIVIGTPICATPNICECQQVDVINKIDQTWTGAVKAGNWQESCAPATPTPPTTPTPPVGPMCLNISMLDATSNETLTTDPTLGDTLIFRCANVANVDHYIFRVIEPDQTIITLNASGSISEEYTITNSGKFYAQCQVCSGASDTTCNAFENPMTP